MGRSSIALLIVIALFIAGLAVLSAVSNKHYLLVSFVLIAAAMVPFYIRFEQKDLHARELVLIAMLAAIAAISRVPFGPIPSVQPTTFVIIAAAVVFGRESGFLIGAVAALVSNMLMGQGPWTPWQMFGWGMVGFSAGMLGNARWLNSRWGLAVFGLIWGFLFGWLMDVWVLVSLQEISWRALFTVFATSFYFDLAHALSNVFFLVVFGAGWIRILRRFKKKYGLL